MKESWSPSERKKRAKRCASPRGFSMRQFCRNMRTRSKPGQRKNEILEAVLLRLLDEELKIQASVRPSEISGLGLFAAEDIPKGRVVFRWNDDVDQEYSLNYPDRLPPEIKKDFTKMASVEEDGWFLAGDGGAYFNHSDDHNIDVNPDAGPAAKWDRIAGRDIAAGEELTMDYADIGDDAPL